MENNENGCIKTVKIDELNKAYRTIDIKGYDVLYIEGNSFPIHDSNLTVENRALKEPATIEQMIQRLKEHGVTFTDSEYEEAKKLLMQVSYYRISVFKNFLQNDFSFSSLKRMYMFDRFIQEKINLLAPPIEVYIKTTLAQFLSTNYSKISAGNLHPALVYLDNSIYKAKYVNNNDVKRMISNFANLIERKKNTEASVRHYIKMYGGNIPIWVLMEQLTFGQVGIFMYYIKRSVRKQWVDSCVPTSTPYAINEWVNTIRILRNTAAHCAHFYSRHFTYNPKILQEDIELIGLAETELEKFKHSLYAGLLVMKRLYMLLGECEKMRWNEFIDGLSEQISNNNEILAENMMLLDGWENVLRI